MNNCAATTVSVFCGLRMTLKFKTFTWKCKDWALVRPWAFSLHSTELCCRRSAAAAKSNTEHQLRMNIDEWGWRGDFLVMYFSSFQAYAPAWLPDSPLSSACSSITVELYFVISLSSSCRDAALLYSSCSCIIALGFTHLLLRHPSVLMQS